MSSFVCLCVEAVVVGVIISAPFKGTSCVRLLRHPLSAKADAKNRIAVAAPAFSMNRLLRCGESGVSITLSIVAKWIEHSGYLAGRDNANPRSRVCATHAHCPHKAKDGGFILSLRRQLNSQQSLNRAENCVPPNNSSTHRKCRDSPRRNSHMSNLHRTVSAPAASHPFAQID